MNWYKQAQTASDTSYLEAIRNAISEAKKRYGDLSKIDNFTVQLNGKPVTVWNNKPDPNNASGVGGVNLPEAMIQSQLPEAEFKAHSTGDPLASNIVMNRSSNTTSSSQYENLLFHELTHANQTGRALARAGYTAPARGAGSDAYNNAYYDYISGETKLPAMRRRMSDAEGNTINEHYVNKDVELHAHMMNRTNLAINYRDKLIRQGVSPAVAAQKATELFSKDYASYMNRANVEPSLQTDIMGRKVWKMSDKKWQKKLENYRRRMAAMVRGYKMPVTNTVPATKATNAVVSKGWKPMVSKIVSTLGRRGRRVA